VDAPFDFRGDFVFVSVSLDIREYSTIIESNDKKPLIITTPEI